MKLRDLSLPVFQVQGTTLERRISLSLLFTQGRRKVWKYGRGASINVPPSLNRFWVNWSAKIWWWWGRSDSPALLVLASCRPEICAYFRAAHKQLLRKCSELFAEPVGRKIKAFHNKGRDIFEMALYHHDATSVENRAFIRITDYGRPERK